MLPLWDMHGDARRPKMIAETNNAIYCYVIRVRQEMRKDRVWRRRVRVGRWYERQEADLNAV